MSDYSGLGGFSGAGSFTTVRSPQRKVIPPLPAIVGLVAIVYDPENPIVANLFGRITNPPETDGVQILEALAKSSGKIYYEVEISKLPKGASIGLAITAEMRLYGTFITGLGSPRRGDIIGMGIDLDKKKVSFHWPLDGPWNGVEGSGPSAGAGLPDGAVIPILKFSLGGCLFVSNIGNQPFKGEVPEGFSPGWP